MSVNEERALWWLQRGAQPSDTARYILTKTGVWEKFTGEPAPSYPVAEAVEVASGTDEG
jgi:small subunit ribosomal protein S16